MSDQLIHMSGERLIDLHDSVLDMTRSIERDEQALGIAQIREDNNGVLELLAHLKDTLAEKLPEHSPDYRIGYQAGVHQVLRMMVELVPIQELQAHMVPPSDDDPLSPPEPMTS